MQRVGLPSVIVLAVFSWLLLVAPALAAPRVDGFADVPWGANVDQLKSVMDQRGATLQKQGPDRVEYLGTFANEPARLIFYFDKNIFYQGEAELLNAKGKDEPVIKKYFEEFSNMVTAKYGNAEPGGSVGQFQVYANLWRNLPTAAQPAAQAGISVVGIVDVRKKPDPNKAENKVIISYSVGLDWARAQTLPKDI